MKKLFIVLSLLMVILLGSCAQENSDGTYSIEISSFGGPDVIIIDSCEYVKWGYGMAHKGNCKFCEERCKNKY